MDTSAAMNQSIIPENITTHKIDRVCDEICNAGKRHRLSGPYPLLAGAKPLPRDCATTVQIGYDANSLLVFVHCREPDPRQVETHFVYDGEPFWVREFAQDLSWCTDDAVVLVLAPGRKRSRILEFALNFNGTRYDRTGVGTGATENVSGWYSTVIAGRETRDFIFAIPFCELGVHSIAPGEKWGLEVLRIREDRQPDGNRHYGFQRSSLFGAEYLRASEASALGTMIMAEAATPSINGIELDITPSGFCCAGIRGDGREGTTLRCSVFSGRSDSRRRLARFEGKPGETKISFKLDAYRELLFEIAAVKSAGNNVALLWQKSIFVPEPGIPAQARELGPYYMPVPDIREICKSLKNTPALAPLKQAAQRGEYAKAAELLAAHFRKKIGRIGRLVGDTELRRWRAVTSRETAAARQAVSGLDINPEEWLKPSADKKAEEDWVIRMRGAGHIPGAALLGKPGRDLTAAAAGIVRSWMTAYAQGKLHQSAWMAGLDPGSRIVNIVNAYFTPGAMRAFSTDDHLLFVSAALLHARMLFRHHTSGDIPNMKMAGCNALATVAALFDEFKAAPAWRRLAYKYIWRCLSRYTHTDGFSTECSTAYHIFDTRCHHLHAFQLRQLLGGGASARHRRLMETRFAAMLKLMQPDRTAPVLNDASGRMDLRPFLACGARLNGRADFALFAAEKDNEDVGRSRGKNLPAFTSVALAGSRHYVMRSDWSKQANYLCVNFKPYGGAHTHGDRGAISLSAYGTNVLVDAGTCRYCLPRHQQYYHQTFAHNTVLVDRQGMDKTTNASIVRWESNARFDLVDGRHEGYQALGVIHARLVFFVRNDYWLVWDRLTGVGEHLYEQLWHFKRMRVCVERDNQRAYTVSGRRGNLLIAQVGPERTEVSRRLEYNTAYVAGPSLMHPEERAPCLAFALHGKPKAEFLTLLFPYRGEKRPEVAVAELPTTASAVDGLARALEIRWNDRRDMVWLCERGGVTRRFGAFETDAVAALIREKNGKTESSGFAGGQHVS